MTKLFLSKKAIIAILLGLSLVGAGTASAANFGFASFGSANFFKSKGKAHQLSILEDSTFEIKITSPNGGEDWAANSSHEITWEVNDTEVQEWLSEFEEDNAEILEEYSHERKLEVVAYLTRSYSSKKNIFIGRADLEAGKIDWEIPEFIPAGEDYKVGIAVTWTPKNNLNGYNKITTTHFKNIQRKIAYDESDDYFTITNDMDISEVKESIITQIIGAKQERKDFIQDAKKEWGQNAMEIKKEVWGFRNVIQQFKGWFKSRWFNK